MFWCSILHLHGRSLLNRGSSTLAQNEAHPRSAYICLQYMWYFFVHIHKQFHRYQSHNNATLHRVPWDILKPGATASITIRFENSHNNDTTIVVNATSMMLPACYIAKLYIVKFHLHTKALVFSNTNRHSTSMCFPVMRFPAKT